MAAFNSGTNKIIDHLLTVFHALRTHSFRSDKSVQFDVAIKYLRSFFKLSESEAVILTSTIVNYYEFNEKPVSATMIADTCKCSPLIVLEFEDEFKSLVIKHLLEETVVDDPMTKATFYRIPQQVKQAILKCDKQYLKSLNGSKDESIILPDDIKEKDLFYMPSIDDEVKKLKSYLMPENLAGIRQRLVQQHMKEGITIMLYGAPGTGKTETVFQLAKATGRKVFYVDIGSTISCWHGGTEANVSKLFEKYTFLCKQAQEKNELLPVFLFNEADALFGKRLNPPIQGSEIDENHIQSVLLDKMEKQPGILITTTNMAGNFDEAFERRFLFKIQFEKPDMSVKKKIWKNKLAFLDDETAENLARTYEFSGGEIDNVVRKITMDEVLTGHKIKNTDVEKFCKSEKLVLEKRKTIGFSS